MEPNSTYPKDDIEDAFDYGFGFQIRGINIVTDSNGATDKILVFSKEQGPYEDNIEGDILTYWGDLQGDEDEHRNANNHALIRSMVEDIPAHFFHKSKAEADSGWRYEGEVDVIGVEETTDRQGRKSYKFQLSR